MKRVSAALVLVTIANALASYARETTIAAIFGANGAADAYFSAYAIVTTACDLIIGSAVLTSCIPVLAPLAAAGSITLRDRARLVAGASAAIVVAGTAIALLLWMALPILLGIAAPGLGRDARGTALAMAGAMAWLVPVNGLLALFSATLMAHRRFVAAALSGLGINGLFILAIIALSPRLDAFALPLAALTGPVAVVLAQGVALFRMGLLRPLAIDLGAPDMCRLWALARPTLLTLGLGTSAGLLTLSQLLIRASGSERGEGAIAALAYAFRIYEVPITLIANTGMAILLPMLATLYARSESERIAEVLRNALFWGALLLLPAALMAAAEPALLVRILFHHGRMTAAGAALTAEALQGFAPAILVEAACFFLFQAFYAIRRPRPPLVLSLLTLGLMLGLLAAVRSLPGLTAVALCSSAALAAAALAGALWIQRILGHAAVPEISRALRLALALAVAVAVRSALAPLDRDPSGVGELVGAAVMLAAYFAAVLMLLPGARRSLIGALGNRG